MLSSLIGNIVIQDGITKKCWYILRKRGRESSSSDRGRRSRAASSDSDLQQGRAQSSDDEGGAVKVRVDGRGSPKRRWWNPAGSFPFNHVTSKTWMEPVITNTVAHFSLLSHSLHIQLRVSLEQNVVSTISDKTAHLPPNLLTTGLATTLWYILWQVNFE